jgi:hypothetical protein
VCVEVLDIERRQDVNQIESFLQVISMGSARSVSHDGDDDDDDDDCNGRLYCG